MNEEFNEQDAGMPYHKKILLKNREEYHVKKISQVEGTSSDSKTENLAQPSSSKSCGFSIDQIIGKDCVQNTPSPSYGVKRDHCGTIKMQEHPIRRIIPTNNFNQQQTFTRPQQPPPHMILNEKEIRMHCKRIYKISLEISTINQLRDICYNVNMLNSLPLSQETHFGIFVSRTICEIYKIISQRLMARCPINCHHPLPIIHEFIKNNFKQFRTFGEAQEYLVKYVYEQLILSRTRTQPQLMPPQVMPVPEKNTRYSPITPAPLNNCRETVIITAKKKEKEEKIELKDKSNETDGKLTEFTPSPIIKSKQNSIEDWSLQVKKLLQENRFSPPPEKAKILQKVMISYLTKQEYAHMMKILNKKVKNTNDTEIKQINNNNKIILPKGKLFYHRNSNTLLRYFQQDQVNLFLKNLNNNNVQIKDDKSERYILDSRVVFSCLDKFEDPKDYLDEIKLVEKHVPEDFALFYKYVTAYQVRNHHEPISFQTFLLMHNTDGLNSLIENYKKLYF